MEIIYLNPKDLKPYENNAKKHPKDQVKHIANSIKQFGFKQPIVIDKDNVVIIGHGRLKASIELNLKQVPCVIADDLTEEQIKALRLADNKTNESEWDNLLLDLELNDIDTIDMSDFGFDILQDEEETEEDEEELEDVDKLETHYGVPYQGNKSRIADIIINILPKGKRLVDLFGGGGAITHCALLSDKWEYYLYNDINPLITTLFMDAVNGKYHDECRVITREDFNELKDTDAYVKYIWSFGNNGNTYLWGKNIEEIKQQACHIILDPEMNNRRLSYRSFILMLKEHKKKSLDRIQSLEHLQALTQLESLQRLAVSNIDYRNYEYQDGDIVYCDVPYEKDSKGQCNDYGVSFNSKDFYKWCKEQPYQVFFSSYEISDDSFYKVKVKSIRSLLRDNRMLVNEYLYSNKEIVKGE